MQLFVRGDEVIAQHYDEQVISDGTYGEDIRRIIVPNNHRLDRLGDPPPAGQVDTRPYKAPALEGEVLAHTLKAECGRRIWAVMKDIPTQLNMTAWATDLTERKASGAAIDKGEQDDLETARAGRLWVREMQAKCRELIIAGDVKFDDEAKWPKPPAGVAELADRF